MTNKKPFLESNKKELNKNKLSNNNNKNNLKKKEDDFKINNNKIIKPTSKFILNLSLTPKKNKDSKVSDEEILENNYNYTDRNNNAKQY